MAFDPGDWKRATAAQLLLFNRLKRSLADPVWHSSGERFAPARCVYDVIHTVRFGASGSDFELEPLN